MANPLWKELSERIKALAGNWTSYSILGSFVLYLLGYLSLRFRLAVLGIGTDLFVLDERYIFAGARFLVYLVSSIPIVVMLVLILLALMYLPYRILPGRIRGFIRDLGERIWTWWSDPTRLSLTGIIFSVIMIQFVMRKCFIFSNLLLASSLSGPEWLQFLLLDLTEEFRSLYFSGIVAGTALIGGIVTAVRRGGEKTSLSRFLEALLAFLFAVQVLLLPVNYAVLIVDKEVPRVTDLGGSQELKEGQEAWLIWEGKEGVTFLVRDRAQNKDQRIMTTLLKKDIKNINIVAYDPILRLLFSGKKSPVVLNK